MRGHVGKGPEWCHSQCCSGPGPREAGDHGHGRGIGTNSRETNYSLGMNAACGLILGRSRLRAVWNSCLDRIVGSVTGVFPRRRPFFRLNDDQSASPSRSGMAHYWSGSSAAVYEIGLKRKLAPSPTHDAPGKQ